jgi:DNA replication protein DnaC
MIGFYLSRGVDLIFDAQRLKHAKDYVNAISSAEEGYGVLFSGPNGVGTAWLITLTCENKWKQ